MNGKVCTYCEEEKPFSDFQKDKGMKDGHKNYCKACYKEKIYSYGSKKGTEKRKPSTYIKKGYPKVRIKLYGPKLPRKKYYLKKGRNGNGKPRNPITTVNIDGIEIKGKICTSCKEWKTTYQYHRFSRMEDGLEIYCKACRKEQVGGYFQTEKGRANSYRASSKRRSYKHQVIFQPHERKFLLDRDNWTCGICKKKVHDRSTGKWNTHDKAHIDHIIPISKGGKTEPLNLQVLCRTCNLSKGDKILQMTLG
jgi:hypothetical protein